MKSFLLYPLRNFLFLIIILSLSVSAQEKGRIGGFDDEAKPENKDSTQISSPPSPSSSSDTDAEFSIEAAFQFLEATYYVGEALGYLFASTFFLAPGEDSSFYDGAFWTRGFTLYPYADPNRGMFSSQSEKSFAFSFSGHYFTDRANLTGYGGRLFASPHQSINIEAQFIDLSEKRTTKTDHLRFYNFFLDYNRIKGENISLWWGLGIKGMNGPTVRSTGFAFNSGIEIFPVSPVSMFISYNVGSINSKTLHEFVATANGFINRFDVKFGYQRFSIGNAVLDGMIVGGTMHF